MLDADFGCWTAAERRCRMEECRKSLEMPAERKMPEEPGDARRAKCRKSLEMPEDAWRCQKSLEMPEDAWRCWKMPGDAGRARMVRLGKAVRELNLGIFGVTVLRIYGQRVKVGFCPSVQDRRPEADRTEFGLRPVRSIFWD